MTINNSELLRRIFTLSADELQPIYSSKSTSKYTTTMGGGESWIYFYFSLGMGPSDSAWLVDGFGRFDLILTNFDLILIVLIILSKITNKCNTTMGGRGSGYIFILAKA